MTNSTSGKETAPVDQETRIIRLLRKIEMAAWRMDETSVRIMRKHLEQVVREELSNV